MRVRQCCCGCSLQTGTLILLWLGVIGGIGSVVNGLGQVTNSYYEYSVLPTSLLLWNIISLVLTIYALVGVEKKRPSFLLPYIILCVVGLVFTAVMLFSFLIGSVALKKFIMSEISRHSPRQSDDYHEIEDMYNSFVVIIICCMAIGLAVGWYFTIVVYSYYKQMQEELASGLRTTGIIYAPPSDYPAKGMTYNDYPPAYGTPTNVPQSQINPLYPPNNPVCPQQSSVYPQLPGEKQ